MRYISLLTVLILCGVGSSARAVEDTTSFAAQPGAKKNEETNVVPHHAELVGHLVDADKKAAQKTATVEVTVVGAQLVDPDSVNGTAKPGQGHLHYQLDNGPVIATTATKLSFHDLPPGDHTIVVQLAANDHTPLGPQQTLKVKVP